VADLTVEVIPQQQRYGVEDDIPVRVLLTNISEDPITVNGRLATGGPTGPGELRFTVLDPAGSTVPFGARVNMGRPTQTDFAQIPPRGCIGRTIDLVDYYPLSEPGRYQVSVRYESGTAAEDDWPDGAWQGTVESEPVTIELS